jgi:hypothetical protein
MTWNLKRNLTGWGRADFSINLCASVFDKCLSKESYFGQIHLDTKPVKLPILIVFTYVPTYPPYGVTIQDHIAGICDKIY